MSRSYSSMKDKKRGLSASSQTATKPAKKKQPYNPYISLSQAMCEYPQSFEENKISVVQKFISEIDLLPKKFQKVETLYLSSNNIKSLQGIQQFSNLRNLSLANNEIDDAASLHALEDVRTIEVLNLSGNPICRLPNYRSLIISILPCLRMFDGKAVTPELKHKSEVNLRTQSGLLDLLLSNYCELIKFNNLLRKLELHQQLLQRHPRFRRNYIPMDVGKWKKMFDFESQLDDQSKYFLKANLLQDVNTIKAELGLKDDENEVAFSELILRQQQKIAALLFKAEEAVRHMSAYYSSNREVKQKSVDFRSTIGSPTATNFSNLKNSRLSSPGFSVGPSTTKNKSTKQVTISDTNNTIGDEPKPLRKKILKSSDNFEKDIYQKLGPSPIMSLNTEPNTYNTIRTQIQTPQTDYRGREITFPGSITKSSTYLPSDRTKSPSLAASPFRNRLPSPSKLSMSPTKVSPHKDECCRSLHKRVNQMEYDPMRASTRSPLNKRLEEKERLVGSLAKDLRAKNQELIKMEGLTQHLTEKLRSFQEMNGENVKVAQEEIDAIARELEQSLESQENLEDAVRSLKLELGDLYRKNYDLEEKGKRFDEVEAKAISYARELEERTLEEGMMVTAEKFSDKRLKVKAFKLLRKGVRKSRHVGKFTEMKKAQKQKKTLKNIFGAWNQMVILNKYIKAKKLQKQTRMKAELFFEWQNYTCYCNKIRGHVTEQNERLLKKSVVAWKQYMNEHHRRVNLNKKVDQYFINKTKKRAFKRFVEIRKRVQFDPAEEKALTKKAQKYYAFNLKRQLYLVWKKWTQTEVRPMKAIKQKGQKFSNKRLLTFGFKIWTQYMKVNESIAIKVQRKIQRNNKNTLAKFLGYWKRYSTKVVPIEKQQEEKRQMFIKKRLLKVWVGQYNLKLKLKASMEKAVQQYQLASTKRIFKHLAKLRLKKKQLKFFGNIVQTKCATAKMTKLFSKWSKLWKAIQQERKDAKAYRIEAFTTYFAAWKKHHSMCMEDKIRQHNFEKHMAKVEKNQVVKVLHGWFNHTRVEKRNKEIIAGLANRRRLTLYRNVLFELLKNTRQSIKHTMNKMLARSAILEAKSRDNAEYVNDLDEEKMELRDKAHMYQEEVVQLNMKLEERDREINNLNRVLQQCEKNEKNLCEEVSLKATINKELETKLHRNSSEHQYVYAEYEKEIELLKEERSNLLRQVSAMERELEFKQRTLIDTEKSLLEKSSQAQNMVYDVEKKFANSVKMASEFRNVIEVKEDQVSSLMAQLQKALEDKQEYKNKLAEALTTTKETRDFYEGKMKFLETQNLEMLSNMEYLKDGIAKQQRHIGDLKSDLRKSQHKIEIMADRNFQDDQKYVRSLRKEASLSPVYRSTSRSRSPLRSPKIDKFRREYSAEKKDYNSRKLDIDQKISVLENYMSPGKEPVIMQSPPYRVSKYETHLSNLSINEPKMAQFPTSARSLKTADCTRLNDSEYEIPTREVTTTKQVGFFKPNVSSSSISIDRSPLNDQRLSVKNLDSRERSPLSARSPTGQAAQKGLKSILKTSVVSASDANLDKMKRERYERREGLEKRLESLTLSLKSDLQRARNRVLD